MIKRNHKDLDWLKLILILKDKMLLIGLLSQHLLRDNG